MASSDASSNTAAETFARDLHACLDAKDRTAAPIAFIPEMRRAADLPRVTVRLSSEGAPHPLTGVGLALISGALVQAGRGLDVVPFQKSIADLFAPPHRYYAPGSNYGDMLSRFPFLDVPLIKGALAGGEQLDAVSLCLRFAEHVRHSDSTLQWIFEDPYVAGIMAHPAIAGFGPFHFDREWMLKQQESIRAIGPMNGLLERVVDFDELLLVNALLTEQPQRGLTALGPDGKPDAAFLARAHLDHLGFNAVCLLAALGRNDAALQLARHIVRRGYSLRWRFNLETAAKMDWTQRMRQNEWLAALAATPDYQAFLAADIQYRQVDEKDPNQTAICAVRAGTWGGKKKTKCFISKTPIMPGDAIVRVRRVRGHRGFDDFEIASIAGVAASGWQSALREFETDTVPLRRMFGPVGFSAVQWDDPEISAFHHDSLGNPDDVDVARAVAIVAAHNPPPIRRNWIKGPDRTDRYHEAFDPWAGDTGHGEPLTLLWCLIKAGHREKILAETARLPAALADKVFAMLATFDDATIRAAAAKHFGLPDLPAMMELVFAARLTLEQHIAIADVGRAHPRFRAGIAAAMQSYGLHLYSNYHPTADWFLAGLEHYTMGHGCHLLFFLIHHPGDDLVLKQTIETGWLPDGVSAGGYDAYDNVRTFYFRAASLHLGLNHPEKFAAWMQRSWLDRTKADAKGRETFRVLDALGKSAAKKPAKPRAS